MVLSSSLVLFAHLSGKGFSCPLSLHCLSPLFPRDRRKAYANFPGRNVSIWPVYFATQKSSVVSYPRWTFKASPEACRRAAVTPQPALMSHECPVRIARSPKGAQPPSPEACRRMAVYTRQQAGNRTRPASRGTRRATAVTPQPALMSHDCPARIARRDGCRALALPESAVRVAGHAPVATRTQTDGAYLGAVGNAVALELLLEKTA